MIHNATTVSRLFAAVGDVHRALASKDLTPNYGRAKSGVALHLHGKGCRAFRRHSMIELACDGALWCGDVEDFTTMHIGTGSGMMMCKVMGGVACGRTWRVDCERTPLVCRLLCPEAGVAVRVCCARGGGEGEPARRGCANYEALGDVRWQ